MKIGIITFHASFNYGSMLQAYALAEYIKGLGHIVEIINFRSKEQKELYRFPLDYKSSGFSKWRVLVYSIIKWKLYLPRVVKWVRFNSFMNSMLPLSKEFNSLQELTDEKFDYDIIITGSDQSWNTKCIDYNDAYYGVFSKGIRKIAFSVSLGDYPERQSPDYIRPLLDGFSSLSVRETKTKQFIEENHLFHPVEVTIDPTFFFDASFYDKLIASSPIIEGEYVFFYEPFINPQYFSLAVEVGKALNIKIVSDRRYLLTDNDNVWVHNNVIFYESAGPREFINLIKNSTIVVAHSLHALIFSLIYKKNFYVINGKVDSRLFHLLETFCLLDRALDTTNINTIDFRAPIKYDASFSFQMEELITTSKSYLSSILSY